MNLKKLHTNSVVHSSPLLLFRKPEFFHTFSVIRQHKLHKVWKKSNYLKSYKGLLCSPHLVYSFFKLEYIQLGRISWLWVPMQTFNFPSILSWLPSMPLKPWRGPRASAFSLGEGFNLLSWLGWLFYQGQGFLHIDAALDDTTGKDAHATGELELPPKQQKQKKKKRPLFGISTCLYLYLFTDLYIYL